MLIVVVVIVVGAAAAGVLLSSSHSNTTSSSSSTLPSTTSSSGGNSSSSSPVTANGTSTTTGPFAVNYDELQVGYNGGLWNIGLQGTGGKQVQGLVITLHTKTEAVMCTGFQGGLSFSNCIAGPGKSYTFTQHVGGNFPANATYTGYATGAGPGSAVVGQTYQISVFTTFADGATTNSTISVVATSGAG